MNKRKIGSLQEEIATDYLQANGFVILERNYRCKVGEIDVIACKDDIIRFIEIKYRKNYNYGYPSEAVSRTKQLKIIRSAQWYINQNKLGDINCSFDVISICGNNIEYIFNCYGAM